MGKKQHQGDKTYVSANEYAWYFGGRNAEKIQAEKGTGFRRLPFDHCALSMQPFTTPYITRSGHVFEISAILPFLKKNGVNPVTGGKLSIDDLIPLKFSKNKKDQFHCPITYKVFTNSSFIVAIASSGNVYSMEAVAELNLKQKNMKDLIDGSAFKKSDILTVQDPNDVEKHNINNFYFVKKSSDGDDELSADIVKNLNRSAVNSTANLVIAELQKSYSQKHEEFKQKVLNEDAASGSASSDARGTKTEKKPKIVDKINSAHFSKGKVAASLTSTAVDVNTKQEAEVLDDYTVKYKYVKKKGYARLVTNFGDLNLELFCQDVPKTCDNFMTHLVNGYYRNTIFHRLIKHFVLQGGDPTGTGTGGKSSFPGGEPFQDEFKPNLTHSGRGMLSMANSGPDANKSQFFITFRPCQNLDGKHSVFGKLVGGMETLSKIEQVKTDKSDRPEEDVRIVDTVVFVNPFEEAEKHVEEMKNKDKEAENEKKEKEDKEKRKEQQLIKYKTSGVGQYLNLSKLKRDYNSTQNSSSEGSKGANKQANNPAISKSGSLLSEETQLKLAAKKQKLGNFASSSFGKRFSGW